MDVGEGSVDSLRPMQQNIFYYPRSKTIRGPFAYQNAPTETALSVSPSVHILKLNC